jgi:hypothetical protein
LQKYHQIYAQNVIFARQRQSNKPKAMSKRPEHAAPADVVSYSHSSLEVVAPYPPSDAMLVILGRCDG